MVETQHAILQAAKTVFLRKGLAETSMKDIAEATGMSRTLLHYYYRKKEMLFHAILLNAVSEIIPKVNGIIETDLPLIVKIERVIDTYLDLLLSDPMYPNFLLMETQRDPTALVALIRSHSGNFGSLQKIQQQLKEESRVPVPEDDALAHLFVSVFGPILFPFLARPALDEVFFQNDPDAFPRFMRHQKVITMAMLRGLLKTPEEIQGAQDGDGTKPAVETIARSTRPRASSKNTAAPIAVRNSPARGEGTKHRKSSRATRI
jgi:AcrR family transcriptional regulator